MAGEKPEANPKPDSQERGPKDDKGKNLSTEPTEPKRERRVGPKMSRPSLPAEGVRDARTPAGEREERESVRKGKLKRGKGPFFRGGDPTRGKGRRGKSGARPGAERGAPPQALADSGERGGPSLRALREPGEARGWEKR